MSNPNGKIDSRVNEPLGVGSTPDCFNSMKIVWHLNNSNIKFLAAKLLNVAIIT